ncbi:MAG: hypothetical protein Q9225_007627 [Loekoesia sp. 1 TL-2023]
MSTLDETLLGGVPSTLTKTDIAETMNTLFPKIGKLSDFIHRFKKLAPETRIIPLAGSVKLHGAHADWVISSDDAIRVQSRNLLELSSCNDIYGLFAFTTPLHTAITRLRDDILRRFTELDPQEPIDSDCSVIISGEWCGQGIQKGVAISQLPKHFVIFSICINGVWVDEKEYADICNEADGIHNIGKVPCYRFDFNLDDIECSELAVQAFVNAVEQTCPYGLARGVEGPGEGIVWKAIGYERDPEMWFKYKAESHAVSHSAKLPVTALAPENREREDNFATAVVTERRLQQGWEYLREMGVTRDKAATGRFVAWVTNDVLTEEGEEMARKKISKGKLRPSIKSIAGAWYKKRLSEIAEGDKCEMEAITEMVENMAT